MTQALTHPIDAIIFDCDGTLSKLEGINELARMNGVEKEVSQLTERAMSEGIFGSKIYEKRLSLTRPTKDQVQQLGHDYFTQATTDITHVIKIFKQLHKEIFIVTAGLTPAIQIFATKLNIKFDNIFAVDVIFDQHGQYQDFDRQSPLVELEGKHKIAQQIKKNYPRILHVGDGMNDFSTFDIVTRFVGYGGVYFREKMKSLCEFYITSDSTAPLLPLALTQEEINRLNGQDRELFEKGVNCFI
jgi:phosphoserine phosphatase